ncbi:MAG: hypothetical protein PHY54_17890 [Methylococcales bacterium]|nr:hypothetical protein [Methylococcales bacterium]
MSRFTKIDNRLIDKHMANLSGNAFKLILVITRILTSGQGDKISCSKLKEYTNIKDDRTIKTSLTELENAGLISKSPIPGCASKYELCCNGGSK